MRNPQRIKKKTDGNDGLQPDSTLMPLPAAIEWNCWSGQEMDAIVRHALMVFNRRLAIQFAPTHDQVCILEKPRILIAKVDLQPLALRIIPNATSLTAAVKSKSKKHGEIIPDWTITGTGSDLDSASYTRVQVEESLGEQNGSKLIVDLTAFLKASSAAAKRYRGQAPHSELVSVQSGTLEFNIGQFKSIDANFHTGRNVSKSKAGMKQEAGLQIAGRMRYWTNTSKVPRGSAIALPAKGVACSQTPPTETQT